MATEDESAAAGLNQSVSAVRTARLGEINWSDLGSDGKLGVDLAMSPFSATNMLLVSESGSIHLSTLESGTMTTYVPSLLTTSWSHGRMSFKKDVATTLACAP